MFSKKYCSKHKKAFKNMHEGNINRFVPKSIHEYFIRFHTIDTI